METNYYAGIDIGGSHISCALIDSETGEIKGNIEEANVNCNGTATEILQAWAAVINKVISGQEIAGIGIAIPGPFDYTRGISLIKGVQKFESLFGLNVKESICAELNKSNIPFTFINDASAFALGEYYAGAAKDNKKSLVITIGTGLGSTFLNNGTIETTASESVPENGYLYNIPFKNSMGDDYFSTRWFINAWLEKTGEKVPGVKEIAQLAMQEDVSALSVFDEFSTNLAGFISPWLQEFNPDTLVIGGNIAKASPLFIDKLTALLQDKNIGTAVKVCQLWEKSPLIGAAINSKNTLNKTLQFQIK